jgi:hypothetical protein
MIFAFPQGRVSLPAGGYIHDGQGDACHLARFVEDGEIGNQERVLGASISGGLGNLHGIDR